MYLRHDLLIRLVLKKQGENSTLATPTSYVQRKLSVALLISVNDVIKGISYSSFRLPEVVSTYYDS